MFKSIKNILIAGAAVICLAGCEGVLVTPPVGSLSPDGYYDSPAHVEQGVLGVYSKLRDVEVNQYILASEHRSDNVWVDPAPNGIREPSEIAHYRWNNNIQSVLSGLWANWYSLIYNANTVLASIDAVEFEDEAVKKQFKGELLFLRGYAHFELARAFGNVPVVDHVLSAEESKTLKQTAAADVIKGIVITDLTEAMNLLPTEDGIKDASGAKIGGQGRADQIVVKAMLGRVYMTLAGWPYNDATAKATAQTYLKAVLDYSSQNGNKYWAPTIKDWHAQFMTDNSISNKYQIFSIQHTEATGSNLPINTCGRTLCGYYKPNGGGVYNLGAEMSCTFLHAEMRYLYGENDKRGKDFLFMDTYPEYQGNPAYSKNMTEFTFDGKKVEVQENSLPTKWIPHFEKREAVGINYDDSAITYWPMNFPVLRLEDIMLLYAECIVSSDVAGAMGYVNKIRERAGVELVPTNASAADALNYIKRERKLELFMEGIRWFDQIRYGEWVETTKASMNTYLNSDNATYKTTLSIGNVTEGRYLLSIPQSEMRAVPGLYVQNKGWENYS